MPRKSAYRLSISTQNSIRSFLSRLINNFKQDAWQEAKAEAWNPNNSLNPFFLMKRDTNVAVNTETPPLPASPLFPNPLYSKLGLFYKPIYPAQTIPPIQLSNDAIATPGSKF